MRWLRNSLLVLTCAVVVLGVGSAIPRLAFSDRGVGAYSGEKHAFAKFALVYDASLRDWPFPIDPTVARRVTDLRGTHDADSPCTSKGFTGDYRAEVVHYGPFFVQTGKNVFNCDVASTYISLLPRSAEGAFFNVLGSVVLIGAFGLAFAAIIVPTFLTLGGGILLVRGSQRDYRMVGLTALVSGVGLALTELLAIATTPI
jgi:hypothetical protein